MSLIRISESEDFIVDYDKERGMYRVSVFNNGHFQNECWFDCYEERELSSNEDIDKLPYINIKETNSCIDEENCLKTCKKDCIHYEVCNYHIDEETDMTVNECGHFNNKYIYKYNK